MSIAEEDTELRDLVVQTLESNGVLGKLKAHVRASVYLALGEEEKKNPLENDELGLFSQTTEGGQVISLFQEFLKHFNLEYTLAVFNSEANTSGYLSRDKLAKEFGLSDVGDKSEGPIICELLRRNRKPSLEGKDNFDLDKLLNEKAQIKKSESKNPDIRALGNRRSSEENEGSSISSNKASSTDSTKFGRRKKSNAINSDDDNSKGFNTSNSKNSTPRDRKSSRSARVGGEDDYEDVIEEDIEEDSSNDRSDSISKDDEMTSDRTLSPVNQSSACDYIENVLKT